MAHTAIGRARIATLPRLSVNAVGIGSGLILMTRGAFGLRNVSGVRIRLVVFVAGIAGQPGVCALFQFLILLMARDTLHRLRASSRATARRSQEDSEEGNSDRRVQKCPARHGLKPPDSSRGSKSDRYRQGPAR